MNTYQSQNVVYGKAFLNTVIDAFKTRPAAELAATCKVRLSSNPSFNPAPDSDPTVLATSEAIFSGYPTGGASLTITEPVNLSSTVQGGIGSVVFEGDSTDPFISATAYGYWVESAGMLVLAEVFSGSQSCQIASTGDFLDLDVRLPMRAYQATS